MEQLKDVLREIGPGVLDVLPQKINSVVGNNSIKKAFYNLYSDVGWTFYREQKFKKSLSEDIERSLWDQWFEKIIEQETGTRITLITDYSKEILINAARKALKSGQEQGLGMLETERLLRESLTDEFRTMARMRSLRIVQTEVMSASNFATMKSGMDSGLQMNKVWLTAPIGIAKNERHATIPGLDGQKRRKEEDFNVDGVPMAYPGDPKGGAENVINCRCSLSWEPIEDNLNL
jgi:hypothetical protein